MMGTVKLILSLICLFSALSLNACDKNCNHGKTWATEYVTYSFVRTSYIEHGLHSPSRVYPLGTYLKGISVNDAKSLAKKAARHWSQFSGVKMIYVSNPDKAMVRIGERSLDNLVAGMGYFPGNKPINGDIHIDNSSRIWNEDLYYRVVLHEMGHSLGLVHNDNKESVMYYKIQKLEELQDQDIAHLQNLYGPPKNQTAGYNSKKVPHFTARINSFHAHHGEAVEVTITGKHRAAPSFKSQYTGTRANIDFFAKSRGWYKLSANAKDNKNQCMRMTSKAFKATNKTVWNVERSYLFHGTEKINYLISTDNGVTFSVLQEESGTSNRAQYFSKAIKKRSQKHISLAKYAGKNVIVAIEYKNIGLYWDINGHGLKVYNMTLNHIGNDSILASTMENKDNFAIQ